MFHSIIIALAAISLASLALAQSSNTTLDPNSITLSLRSQWCQAQINTCGILCSGNNNDNTCTPDTLTYDCICASNSSSPDLAAYTQTLPTFICEQLYTNCISAASGNASAQADCQTNIEDGCGKLDPAKFDASASSSSSASSQKSTTSLSSAATHTTSSSSTSTGSTSSHFSSTSSFVPSTSSSSSSVQGPASATSDPSASGSATSTPKTSAGLSTGTKAGIAIGAILGVILLCTGGYLLGRRHRGASLDREDKHPNVPELSTNGLHEIPQLETKERPGELSGAAITRPSRSHELE
ncbi:uncharacterized protein PAC_01549 [Phialocephala subalpina]|uniref:DUF7707 domain-containing protein n=1 Tax=Phialocephala subalpina TaxID=576137 RepID=A0A1L7WFX1_9HELO|nr:uncharacterized protein PAC_01549 [Phialocephala subalpina]